MALKIPMEFYEMRPVTGHLRRAGSLDGTDLDGHFAFRSVTGRTVLGIIQQLSYQGAYVDISYIPLFADWRDDSDYPEVSLLHNDLIWRFHLSDIEEVIALRQDLAKALTNNMASGD